MVMEYLELLFKMLDGVFENTFFTHPINSSTSGKFSRNSSPIGLRLWSRGSTVATHPSGPGFDLWSVQFPG